MIASKRETSPESPKSWTIKLRMKQLVAKLGITVSMFGMLIAFQNCGRPGDVASTTESSVNSAQITQLKSSILSMSQSELSCSQDADCTVVSMPVSTGCGPQEYWVTSKNNPALPEAEQLANQLSQEELAVANEQGTVFECSFIMPPVPTCQQNVCAPSKTVAGN